MPLSKAKKYSIVLFFLSIVFFMLYSFTVVSVWLPQWLNFKQLIFNWPDANANYFFVQLFAEQGTLSWHEPLNSITDNLLHTRSINVVDSSLVPMTFLPGLILFGLGAKLLGPWGVLLLTPLLATLTVYIIYRLSFYIFKDLDLSFLIALLFFPLAPWLYFANVVMLPTILFIFLVSAGWLFIAKSLATKKNLWWILGTVFLSLAVAVRPTELLWLALIWIFMVYTNRQQLKHSRCLASICIFLAILITFLSFNKLVYGGYLSFGYLNLQANTLPTEFSGQEQGNIFNYIKLLVMPFGFDIVLIAKNFVKYFVNIIWYQVTFAIAGTILLLANRRLELAWKKYFLLTPFVFILILLFYGSWDIADPLVKELNTISISYVRYFMPLYIWLLPLSAYAIKRLFSSKDKTNQLAYYVIIFAMAILSIKAAFYAKHDGLFKNQENLLIYQQQFKAVHKIIPEDAIIMTDRSDKVFFPAYKVIVDQGDLPLWPRISNIIDSQEIYYFSDKSEQEINDLRPKANSNGIAITDQAQIDEQFKLYKIIRLTR
jgi:hypothetical protein